MGDVLCYGPWCLFVQFVEHFVADCMSKLYISQLMVWVWNSKYTAKKAMGLKEEEGNAREQQMNRSLPSLNILSLCTTIFSPPLWHIFFRGSHWWANPNLAVTGRELQPKFFQLLFQTPQHLDKPKLFKLSKIIRNHSKSFMIHDMKFMI